MEPGVLNSAQHLVPQEQTVMLVQIVMFSPGTHLVQNREFQSRTSEPQLKNKSEIENDWAIM